MLILLSPAKTLDFTYNNSVPNNVSEPEFLSEALELVSVLRNQTATELAKLMSISSKLGELNYQRFQDFSQAVAKPALYAYKGDVYDGFELDKYNQEKLDFASQHLRIISGLYGILKPLDLIKPYRLEMSTKLINQKGNNLYDFWKKKLTDKLNQEYDNLIINLASQEYSSAVDKLNKTWINISFKEEHKNEYKVIGIHAKKARGVMANFIIQNFINNPEELKNFNLNNYQFVSNLSSASEYVFVR
jgi:cytoplasmic iron level regulating protein YaaA (DUF328/UPF0246 family)